MTSANCITCGSVRVHRSHHRNAVEKAFIVIGMFVRCHECNSRFAQIGKSLIRLNDLHRASRKLSIALAMVLAAILVLTVILWLGRAESILPGYTNLIGLGKAAAMAARWSA